MTATRGGVAAAVAQELRGPARIAAPELESLGAGVGYVAVFRDAMARLTIDGLRQGRDGLKGDVRVEAGPFGAGEYRALVEGRLELASLSQREAWERRLKRRWQNTDWDAVMDGFCAAVLQAEKRLTKPAISLRDAARPPVSGMLLEPLILAGLPTLWYGDGGSAKSLTALAAAISLVEGIPVIGRHRPSAKLRVLMADFEYDEWEHRENLRRLCRLGADVPSDALPDITYLDCKGGTLTNQAERIQRTAKLHESQFLVVDSVSYAADGPLNDDETARLYYRALAAIGLPSLSTGHQPKNADTKTPFGSVHWRNLARLVWHFAGTQRKPGELLVKATCNKANGGQIPPPIGLQFTFRPDSIAVQTPDPERMPDADEDQWQQIARALRLEGGRAMTYLELQMATGIDVKEVGKRVGEHLETFVKLPPAGGGRQVRIGLKARHE